GMAGGALLERAGMLTGFAVVVLAAMIAVGVYGSEALRSLRFAAARLLVAVSLAIIALAVLDFVLPGHTFWRSTLFYAMLLSIALLLLNRLLLGGLLGTSAFRRRVLVLGAGARAARLKALGQRPDAGFVLVGYVNMNEGAPAVEEAIPRAAIDDLSRFVADLGASEVVLALEERRNALP